MVCDICGRDIRKSNFERHYRVCSKRPTRQELVDLIDCGLTQAQAADEIGVSVRMFKRWLCDEGLTWQRQPGTPDLPRAEQGGVAALLAAMIESAWADVGRTNGKYTPELHSALCFLFSPEVANLVEAATGTDPAVCLAIFDERLGSVLGGGDN